MRAQICMSKALMRSGHSESASRLCGLLLAFVRFVAICLALLSSLYALAFGESSPNVSAKHGFVVFDGLLYRGKPDLRNRGLVPIAGSGNLWRPGVSTEGVDEVKIAAMFAPYRNSDGFYYLDIENWPLMSVTADVRLQNEKKLERVIDLAHRAAPHLRLGFYGILPTIVYWPLMRHDAEYLEWRSVNQQMDPLSNHVDAVFPSLYTFYSDLAGWKSYARQTLIEARRYGKPVYAFLWPQFHDSNAELGGHEVPPEYWRAELELCAELADGVVLWGGYQTPWDENAAWWRETQSFMSAEHRDDSSGRQ